MSATNFSFPSDLDRSLDRLSKVFVRYVNSTEEIKAEVRCIREIPAEFMDRVWFRLAEKILSDPFLSPTVDITKEELVQMLQRGFQSGRNSTRDMK